MNTLFRTALLLAAFAASGASIAQTDALVRILGPDVASRALTKAMDATTLAGRAVAPNLVALDRIARSHARDGRSARFVIDLYDGVDFEAEVIATELRTSGGTTVFARLPGIEFGSAVFTHEAGMLTASIDMPGGNYMVTPQSDGTHLVSRKAAENFGEERDPKRVFRPLAHDAFSTPDVEPDVPVDSGRLIDVMVLWTPAAQVANGNSTVTMQNLAQASIDNANLTYLNSGVAQRLRLVHRQQVTYTERTSGCPAPFGGPNGSDAFECALYDLTGTSDGQMDTIHALRDQHGADLVALLIDDTAFCGLAWLPATPGPATADEGFSIVDWGCAVGNKSFVHELGHNMGAHHDPYVIGGGGCGDGREPGSFCYSRGIVNTTQRWRSVMAYNNLCSVTPPGTSCTRIQYMSNPKLTYTGSTLGSGSYNNNAHSTNKTAKAIAAYRPTSALHPVPQRFTDVATNHPFYGHIEFFAQAGITTGCAAGLFCPDDSVSRRQMAVFLERAMRASNWDPPGTTSTFTDVLSSQFADFIEALRTDGITSGCTATTYCPESAVSRAQMAVFVLRARCGSSYSPNLPGSQTFADVPHSLQFANFIEKLYALGITGGCATGPLRYCPGADVTRGQMATFVERAYPFLTPSEVCSP